MSIASRQSTWTERWFHAMGSEVHVQVLADRTDLVADVGEQLGELEECWSRFRPSSELCRLNEDRRTSIGVSPLLMAPLHRARVAWDLTEGRFDPTVHDSLRAAGYAETFPTTATRRGDLTRCRPADGMGAVTLDLERNVIERPSGLRFDLGGIGKGLAADIIATRLVERGAAGVCIGMGGDVRVAGTAPPGGWVVPVEDPRGAGSERLGDIWFDATLDAGAIVTSTRLFRAWTTVSGERAHHIIEPASGRPAEAGVDAAVVAAAEAWWAEALAKAALVAGPVEGRQLLERHGATGWIVPTAFAEAAS